MAPFSPAFPGKYLVGLRIWFLRIWLWANDLWLPLSFSPYVLANSYLSCTLSSQKSKMQVLYRNNSRLFLSYGNFSKLPSGFVSLYRSLSYLRTRPWVKQVERDLRSETILPTSPRGSFFAVLHASQIAFQILLWKPRPFFTAGWQACFTIYSRFGLPVDDS